MLASREKKEAAWATRQYYTHAANGDPGSHGDNDAGQKLEDCVRKKGGFRQ
jgi:hypothetical protein